MTARVGMLDTLAPDLLEIIVARFDAEVTRLFAQVCSAFKIPVELNKRCVPFCQTDRCQDGCGLAYPLHELKHDDYVTWTKAWALESAVVVRIWTEEWGSKRVVSQPVHVLFNLMDAQDYIGGGYVQFIDVDLVFLRLSKKGNRITYRSVPGIGSVEFTDKSTHEHPDATMIELGINHKNVPKNVEHILYDRFYTHKLARALHRKTCSQLYLSWVVNKHVFAGCRPIIAADGFLSHEANPARPSTNRESQAGAAD